MREIDDIIGDAPAAARDRHRFAAQRFGQTQRIGDAIALFFGELQAALGLDAERRPRRVQTVRQPLGVAHQSGRARILADAHKHALAQRPKAPGWRAPACE